MLKLAYINFLRRKTTWSNMELGLIKACLSSAGILAAIYFYEYLKGLLFLFWAVFGITFLWSGYLWVKKMNE